MADMTWEQAVDWLRAQPEQQDLVRDCYYDDPLLGAAKRFAKSAEWQAVTEWFPRDVGAAIDLGAGRGISSYALAAAGWSVTAVEPDDSALVGAQAISRLARESGLMISVRGDRAEALSLPDESFDLVHGRQVLHHADDLGLLCREAARVLRPGGRFVATREHVITKPADLPVFLKSHPLHRHYGGENAFELHQYVEAMEGAGFRIVRVLGPMESVINYFPTTHEAWCEKCRKPIAGVVGRSLANLVGNERHALGRWILRGMAARLSKANQTPGRLYSFIADKKR